MCLSFTHLEWDTAFFGFNVARITQTDSDGADLTNILRFLRDKNYRLAYWCIPAETAESSLIAQKHGAFLADEKVTYAKVLAGISDSLESSTYTATPYPGTMADLALINLAIQSSEFSRFRLDPLVPRELCDKLYTSWIERSVSKEIAWETLVVKEQNDLLGLITLGTKDGRGDIGLVAVAEHERGKGIGKALVTAADKHFSERGYTLAQVVTQRCNLGACRLYESCGYQIENIENVFHFWL